MITMVFILAKAYIWRWDLCGNEADILAFNSGKLLGRVHIEFSPFVWLLREFMMLWQFLDATFW